MGYRFKPLTMLRSIAIRQLGIFRVPISNCSYTTMIQDHKPTPPNKNQLHSIQNVSKKDKISVILSKILDLEDNKEAVYGTLDAWVAEEHEFPIGRVKTALLTLEKIEKWHKVVQVIKWMLSKGQGRTVGTYGQLIRALDMDNNRVEEAKRLWGKKLSRDVGSIPWKVCDIMISMYYRNEMWEEVVKLFKNLENHGRKPQDRDVLQRVVESYEKLGLVQEKERVFEKYKSLFSKTRGNFGKKPGKELWKG